MKGKPLEMSLLFDFYGETLTEKQRELFDLYYNEDLSLSEIAEHAGITRQGVRDAVKRAEHALQEMEDRLGLVSRYGDTEKRAEALAREVGRLRSLNAEKPVSYTHLVLYPRIKRRTLARLLFPAQRLC